MTKEDRVPRNCNLPIIPLDLQTTHSSSAFEGVIVSQPYPFLVNTSKVAQKSNWISNIGSSYNLICLLNLAYLISSDLKYELLAEKICIITFLAESHLTLMCLMKASARGITESCILI